MALNRAQIKARVRALMRDDGYPSGALDDALVRVIYDINNSGPFKFQKTFSNYTLATSDYDYTISGLLETDVIYNPQSTDDTTGRLRKMRYEDAVAEGRFNTAASALGIPEVYARVGDVLYIDPVPSATANGKTLRVVYSADIVPPTTDATDVATIPDRYHAGLIVYGVLAEVAPALQISTGDGYVPATVAYQRAFTQMVRMEKWESHIIPQVIRDPRWQGINAAGNKGAVRS